MCLLIQNSYVGVLTRLCTTSFGTPLSFIVDACETRLLVLEQGQRRFGSYLRQYRDSHLAIRQPEDRQPEEYLTGFDATSNFLHPRIIEGHPCWFVCDLAWLRSIPDVWIRKVLPRSYRIEREAPFQNQAIRSH